MTTTRVLIIDDSAFIRQMLKSFLESDPSVEVVGVAADPLIAWDKIGKLNPDVLTLDVEMPNMDGLSFLQQLMRKRPMPVVMFSSQTESGCHTTLRALELGAVDFVTKPHSDIRERMPELAQEVIEKIKTAHASRLRRFRGTHHGEAVPPSPITLRNHAARLPLVAIGASTGGTEAICEILTALPADAPPVVVVQHMPPRFTRAFADRLNGLCKMAVNEASDGDRILLGHALIAPGDFHMRVEMAGSERRVRVISEPPVNRHRPSVDVLFNSCAEVVGPHAIGIILTGMGDDGARGLAKMREAGAQTLAQDEASCVVFGMPKAAIHLGAVHRVLPLNRMAEAIGEIVQAGE
jgi:two-component system chemotaxis response regulator CheB